MERCSLCPKIRASQILPCRGRGGVPSSRWGLQWCVLKLLGGTNMTGARAMKEGMTARMAVMVNSGWLFPSCHSMVLCRQVRVLAAFPPACQGLWAQTAPGWPPVGNKMASRDELPWQVMTVGGQKDPRCSYFCLLRLCWVQRGD